MEVVDTFIKVSPEDGTAETVKQVDASAGRIAVAGIPIVIRDALIIKKVIHFQLELQQKIAAALFFGYLLQAQRGRHPTHKNMVKRDPPSLPLPSLLILHFVSTLHPEFIRVVVRIGAADGISIFALQVVFVLIPVFVLFAWLQQMEPSALDIDI